MATPTKECRVCYELVRHATTPCACRGSMRFVCIECLHREVQYRASCQACGRAYRIPGYRLTCGHGQWQKISRTTNPDEEQMAADACMNAVVRMHAYVVMLTMLFMVFLDQSVTRGWVYVVLCSISVSIPHGLWPVLHTSVRMILQAGAQSLAIATFLVRPFG